MTADQRNLVILMVVCLVLPAALSWFFAKFKSSWSQRKRVLASALPLPLLIWLLCAYVFIRAVFASKEDCGVDACGMAMAFSTIIAMVALLGFVVGTLSARTVAFAMRKWSSSARPD